jgi:hypothetical protein
LTERADLQFLNEIKFWATKYLLLSWLLGINAAFFAYHLGLKHLRKYLGIPLTFIVFFETRNLAMRNCMDKIYFPIEGLYYKVRGEEKKGVQKSNSPNEGEGKNVVTRRVI